MVLYEHSLLDHVGMFPFNDDAISVASSSPTDAMDDSVMELIQQFHTQNMAGTSTLFMYTWLFFAIVLKEKRKKAKFNPMSYNMGLNLNSVTWNWFKALELFQYVYVWVCNRVSISTRSFLSNPFEEKCIDQNVDIWSYVVNMTQLLIGLQHCEASDWTSPLIAHASVTHLFYESLVDSSHAHMCSSVENADSDISSRMFLLLDQVALPMKLAFIYYHTVCSLLFVDQNDEGASPSVNAEPNVRQFSHSILNTYIDYVHVKHASVDKSMIYLSSVATNVSPDWIYRYLHRHARGCGMEEEVSSFYHGIKWATTLNGLCDWNDSMDEDFRCMFEARDVKLLMIDLGDDSNYYSETGVAQSGASSSSIYVESDNMRSWSGSGVRTEMKGIKATEASRLHNPSYDDSAYKLLLDLYNEAYAVGENVLYLKLKSLEPGLVFCCGGHVESNAFHLLQEGCDRLGIVLVPLSLSAVHIIQNRICELLCVSWDVLPISQLLRSSDTDIDAVETLSVHCTCLIPCIKLHLVEDSCIVQLLDHPSRPGGQHGYLLPQTTAVLCHTIETLVYALKDRMARCLSRLVSSGLHNADAGFRSVVPGSGVVDLLVSLCLGEISRAETCGIECNTSNEPELITPNQNNPKPTMFPGIHHEFPIPEISAHVKALGSHVMDRYVQILHSNMGVGVGDHLHIENMKVRIGKVLFSLHNQQCTTGDNTNCGLKSACSDIIQSLSRCDLHNIVILGSIASSEPPQDFGAKHGANDNSNMESVDQPYAHTTSFDIRELKIGAMKNAVQLIRNELCK